MLSVLTLPLVLSGLARADEPVLCSGDLDAAVATVARAGGRSAWQLAPVRPVDLVPSPEVTVLGARDACGSGGLATSAELAATADRARLRLQRQDWDGAREDLDLARGQLACLGEEADAARAASIHLMTGVVATVQGQPAAARTAFDRAHRFRTGADGRSTLAWDDRLAAPDRGGGAAFEAAAGALAAAPTGAIVVAPGVDPRRVSLRVDGQTRPLPADGRLPLAAGYHLVQVLTRTGETTRATTLELDLAADQDALLVDPTGLARVDLAELVGQPGLAALLRATVAPRGTVWVVVDGVPWRLDGAWDRLDPVDPAEATRDLRRAASLRGAGVATAGVGLVLATAGFVRFAGLRTSQAWETTTEAQDFRTGEAAAWRGVGLAGGGLVGLGGALALVGQARLQPTATGVALAW